MTNWLHNHHSNFSALEPVNKNGFTFFEKDGCDNIPIEKVINKVKELVKI